MDSLFTHSKTVELVRQLTSQSSGAVEYIDHISAEDKTTPTGVLDITLNKSEGESPVMLVLWGMCSTSSLSLLLGPLRPGVVVLDKVLSMGQMELFDI